MTITGRTRIYGLIGDPIEHVKTPEMHNAKFAARGLDVTVIPIHVPVGALEDFTRMARHWNNLVGIGVTIPHKERMVQLVDELTTPARLCGATNVIRRNPDGRLVGTQMDGPGFVQSLAEAGFDAAGRSALIVGAGGTGSALAFELAAAGVSRLTITNRTREKAETLAARVGEAYPDCVVEAKRDVIATYDLIVNATSVGMNETDPLPVDTAVLTPATLVADVIMSPAETALLRLAREHGCAVHPGRLMLAAQFDSTAQFLGLTAGGTR